MNVSYHSNWPQRFSNQYGHSPIYFQDQMQYVNPNWQMLAVGHAPSDTSQHYEYYASGYSQSFRHHEPNNIMYPYPNHQLHNDIQGYRHHPSWSSLVSSTGSIGSVGSSGLSSIRRRPTKKQSKKKHYVVNSAATRHDGGTLLSMKGKFRNQVWYRTLY